MAEDYPSIPPLGFLIVIGIVILSVIVVTLFLYIKYFQRKKTAALSMAIAFSLWGIGMVAVFVGTLLQFLIQPAPSEGVLQYSRYGFNIAYIFSAASNIYIIYFVSQIFAQTPFFRKTGKMLPLINAIFNGVTIGLIIDAIQKDPYNPAYGLVPTIYHLVLTFVAFGTLLGFSISARNQAIYRWEKAGFGFIIGSALSGLMIYLMIALDRIVTILIPGFEDGYTPFAYIGFSFGILMCTLGYAGYVMPPGLRNWFGVEEVK